LRGIAEGILQEDPLRVKLFKLLHQEPLMRVIAREPIGGQHDDGIELAAPSSITTPIQGGPVESCSAQAIIDVLMLGQEVPSLVLNVVLETAPLTLDGALLLLMAGGHSGVECYLHDTSPDTPE
jgi:hypothetical protein